MNRKKDMYIRSRHIRNRVRKFVHHKYQSSIVSDFLDVIRIVTQQNFIKKNVSRYNYYIIRLASRKCAKRIKKPDDLVHIKTKKKFDDRLFGTIYPILGWDKNCHCLYYLKWKKKN